MQRRPAAGDMVTDRGGPEGVLTRVPANAGLPYARLALNGT